MIWCKHFLTRYLLFLCERAGSCCCCCICRVCMRSIFVCVCVSVNVLIKERKPVCACMCISKYPHKETKASVSACCVWASVVHVCTVCMCSTTLCLYTITVCILAYVFAVLYCTYSITDCIVCVCMSFSPIYLHCKKNVEKKLNIL